MGVSPSFALYATTTYDYDTLGNLTNVTDAQGNMTTITYDTLSRKTSMDDPDMRHWIYDYDLNGNLISQTDAKNQTITFTYDALNRILLNDYPTGTDVTYTYDEAFSTNRIGRLTTVVDASGTTKFYYDKLGRTTKTVKTVNSVNYTTETAYDALGRTDTIKYPDNTIIKNEYDTGGNLLRVKNQTSGTVYAAYSGYNALGQQGSITFANGVTTQYQYRDDNKRLYSITTNSPTAGGLMNLSYAYDNIGNITTITDSIDNNKTRTYTYDALNRLTEANNTTYYGGTLVYQYDKIGNMTYNCKYGNYYYDDNNHRHAVTRVVKNGVTTNYAYDNNGNMISGDGRTFTYDYDNRPTHITYGSTNVDSVYDANGNRVKKTTPNGTTIHIGQLYECTGSQCTKYIFAGSQRVAQIGNTGTYYYHTDHLGSSNILTNSSGNKAQELFYYPYGEIKINNYNNVTKYKFTGQEWDAEDGLYYYGARYYDPKLARFISADTIVSNLIDPQTLNRFSYVRNNPIIYTDPTGHFFGIDDLIAIGIGAAIGAISAGVQSDWDAGAMLTGAFIGGVSGGVGFGAGSWAYGAAGGEGVGAILAGGVVGGAAGGATGGGLSAAFYGGDIGQGILRGAGYGAIAGGVTGGLIALGVPDAIAGAGGGYASGYAQCGGRCAGEGALYSFAGAVLHNALTIASVGTNDTVPAEGSSEWQAMHATNNTYVTTPTVSFKGMDALWMFVALLGGGYSHTWHTNDYTYEDALGQRQGYVPSGHHYKFVQGNVPYPGQNYAENNWNNFRFFSNNCTTRFGYLHPAQYNAYHNYPGQGAYWWGW